MATNNNNKALNVPHLRFPEFSGEWNKYTINDLATVVGGGTPDTLSLIHISEPTRP